jgi:hypothetical protein
METFKRRATDNSPDSVNDAAQFRADVAGIRERQEATRVEGGNGISLNDLPGREGNSGLYESCVRTVAAKQIRAEARQAVAGVDMDGVDLNNYTGLNAVQTLIEDIMKSFTDADPLKRELHQKAFEALDLAALQTVQGLNKKHKFIILPSEENSGGFYIVSGTKTMEDKVQDPYGKIINVAGRFPEGVDVIRERNAYLLIEKECGLDPFAISGDTDVRRYENYINPQVDSDVEGSVIAIRRSNSTSGNPQPALDVRVQVLIPWAS